MALMAINKDSCTIRARYMISDLSPLLFDIILDDLSKGRSLLSICKEMGIERRSVYHYRDQDEARGAAYLKARQDGYDAMADECQEIADEASRDTIIGKFGPKMDAEWVARSKLRIETRLKLLACYDPKRFGQKIDINDTRGKPISLEQLYDTFTPAPSVDPSVTKH